MYIYLSLLMFLSFTSCINNNANSSDAFSELKIPTLMSDTLINNQLVNMPFKSEINEHRLMKLGYKVVHEKVVKNLHDNSLDDTISTLKSKANQFIVYKSAENNFIIEFEINSKFEQLQGKLCIGSQIFKISHIQANNKQSGDLFLVNDEGMGWLQVNYEKGIIKSLKAKYEYE